MINQIKEWYVGMRYTSICNNLFRTIFFLLRRIYSKQFIMKDSPFILLLSSGMAKLILGRILSSEEDAFIKEHTEIIEQEKNNLADNRDVMEIRSKYIYLNSEQRPIDTTSMDQIRNKTKIRLQKEINETVLSNVNKIDITSNQISSIFQILVSIFVITGFLYNIFFLGHFGIAVSQYFTIGDYLSSSIEKIYMALFAVIMVGISLLLYSFSNGSIVDLTLDYTGIVRKRMAKFVFFLVGAYFIIMMVIYNYIDFLLGKNYSIFLLLMLLLSPIYFKWPIERIFKKPSTADFWFLSLVYFFILMNVIIAKEINYIEKGEITKIKNYKISYDKNYQYDDKDWILLAGNSGYMFFYDRNKNKSYAISKALIKCVEMNDSVWTKSVSVK